MLCGKVFDETGDRLTPSHTKTKAGVRLRYYVSHRLIKHSGQANLDGWRLPAEELETKTANRVRQTLRAPSFAGKLAPSMSIGGLGKCQAELKALCAVQKAGPVLALIHRIDISSGELVINLDPSAIARMTDIDPEGIDAAVLLIKAPFQLLRRGVETKLIFADAPEELDQRLIKNVAKAHYWVEQIKSGKTFAQIATAEQASTRRMQQLIELAFLAPDIVRDVLIGKQPLGFTSDWCVRNTIPSDWAEQRALLATL